ncbi:hypothetical protein [Paracoccus sp. (in: a-proteobacteria)]|uniref:hypothetical protein n=1 Tax=Paracoccus sp. TaxID=267 RepID=UPI00396C8913
MTRSEFITVTALILFGAFLLGWLASWLVHRLARAGRIDGGELDRMARKLHEAEEERDAALALNQQNRADYEARLFSAQTEQRSAMDALRESRTEVEELRDYIEQRLARR